MFQNLAYRNGNYLVAVMGNKRLKSCFRINEVFRPDFPDSIDLKISNRCSVGCPFCHEESTSNGKIADLSEIIKHLESLPNEPIEVAIGGGNLVEDEDSFELLKGLVDWLVKKRLFANLTLNEKSINNKVVSQLATLNLEGLGISFGPDITSERIIEISNIIDNHIPSRHRIDIVYHIILGLFPVDILRNLLIPPTYRSFDLLAGSMTPRLLFLGYKQFGRAKQTELPDTIPIFEEIIKESIFRRRSNTNIWLTRSQTLGFDNLAIEQINLAGSLLRPEFDDIYLGPEFSCSMYVDAVEGCYAKSSTSNKEDRVDWNTVDILKYFRHDKS